MRWNTPFFPLDDEPDQILFDDDMNVAYDNEYTYMTSNVPLDEEEAQAYSSVYDIPGSYRPQKNRPKH